MDAETTSGRQQLIFTRVLALFTVLAIGGGVAYLGREGYRALTDSFVAPIILSPDSDLVLASKLAFRQLEVERAKAAADVEVASADVSATDDAIARLLKLKSTLRHGLAWANNVNESLASGGAAELQALAHEREVLGKMVDEQRASAKEARVSLDAGLIAKSDYMKETQTLNQLQVALLENGRTTAQSALALRQVRLAQSSLARSHGAPMMPEAVVREEQLVRIELDLLKLESERRGKVNEQTLARQRLGKMDELAAQMQARPIFRAVVKRMNVAFVPYTQLDGVLTGSRVFGCTWGLVNCKDVGAIKEVVPGEVVLPDPWGNQARGQYVVLDLTDHDAARSKTLRVRGDGVEAVQSPTPTPQRGSEPVPMVSVR